MSGFIPEDIINRVRDSVSIVDLVSRYLSLKKAGASYKALCPFHKEKTPSFVVSPARQSFHCFGCGKGGNVFHFVMAMDRLSFPEAVRVLASDAGIKIPEARGPDVAGEPQRSERERLYEANKRAADFYARMLNSPAGGRAREYLESRGISDEMVERCCLGYSPDSWEGLVSAAGDSGVSADLLCKAGLAISREEGSGCYDRFRNRLMFPIFDNRSRVVGFGARTMADDSAKYLNSPETPVFSKGRNLYGLNWARKSIVDNKRVAVVEGYTDVIMAHQHGVENVVATLGTALTREHIRLLHRLTERIDVVFDSDTAGQQAAERSMELFLSEGAGALVAAGFDVRIATIESGKDPCDLIREQGPEAFEKAIDAAVDVYAKKLDIASQRHNTGTVEGKTRAVDEVLGLVARVPNAVGRQLRIDATVRRLSDTFDIDDQTLRARLSQIERHSRRGERPDQEPTAPATRYDAAERGVLEALLTAPETAPEVFDKLRADDFGSEKLRMMFQMARDVYETSGTVSGELLMRKLEDPDLASLISRVLNRPPGPDPQKAGSDCIRVLLRRRVQKKVRAVRKEFERARTLGDDQRAHELNVEYLKLQTEVQAF